MFTKGCQKASKHVPSVLCLKSEQGVPQGLAGLLETSVIKGLCTKAGDRDPDGNEFILAKTGNVVFRGD